MPEALRAEDDARSFSVGHGLGIASLVTGLLALPSALGLSMCCFFLGWLTLPLSVFGLLLGGAGLTVLMAQHRKGLILPISGIAANVVAICLVVLLSVLEIGRNS
jgi:hypothetical protein